MKLFHQLFGALLVVVFLLTGQYMDRFHNHLEGFADGPRMLYRSRHIYILLAALLNLALGAYYTARPGRLRERLQWTGSAMIAAASALFVAAFFYEPTFTGFHTPYSRPAIYVVAAGTLVHLLAALGPGGGKAVKIK